MQRFKGTNCHSGLLWDLFQANSGSISQRWTQSKEVWHRDKLQRGFNDDSQRAFAAHKQTGQIVPA
jgi:hypothetical protein